MALDVDCPLHRRFVRYRPLALAFGQQRKLAITEEMVSVPVGQAAHADAGEENQRLLYVSMTRARGLLVFARQVKKPTGEWMGAVSLGDTEPKDGERVIKLPGRIGVLIERWELTAAASSEPAVLR
jgi:ATP-dependent helicase/nuclease subunit A